MSTFSERLELGTLTPDERSSVRYEFSVCQKHGISSHVLYQQESACLTCALEGIAKSYGDKGSHFKLKPSRVSVATLERSRKRYENLQGSHSSVSPHSVPGSTDRQKEASLLFDREGSISKVARRMRISRAAAHALLKRAGVI